MIVWVIVVGICDFYGFMNFPSIHAQNYYRHFDHYQLHHGLSNTIIYGIYQDRRGFLWVSTQYGLNRFDGYRFKTYFHHLDDPFSLSANSIGPVYEDPWGYLWIGTWGGGLNRMDPKTGRCDTYTFSPTRYGSINDNRIHTFLVDKDLNLWIGTFAGGLNRLSLRKFYLDISFQREPEFEYITNAGKDSFRLSDNRVWSLALDSSGYLWIGTDNGLCVRDPSNGSIRIYRADPVQPGSLSDNKIFALVCDSKGRLWIGTQNGLNLRDPKKDRFIRYFKDPSGKGLSDNRIRSLWADDENRLWIGTFEGGLQFFSIEQNHWEVFRHDRTNMQSIGSNFIRVVYGDRSGNIWIGAGAESLDKIHRRYAFYHYQHDPNNSQTLSHNDVTCFLEDDEGIWIGTYGGGLDYLQLSSGRWVHYEANPGKNGYLNDHRIRALLKDQEGNIWIGTNGGGVNQWNRTLKRFKAYRHEPGNPQTLSSNRISGLVAEDDLVLWVATEGGGLNRMDMRTGLCSQFTQNPEDSHSLSSNYVNFILRDKYKSQLWIGTDAGLDLMLLPQAHIIRLRQGFRDSLPLASRAVKCMIQDADGYLWFGTKGGGLCRLDPASMTFTYYDESKGLPGNAIYSLLYDGRRYLWMGTGQGLARFDTKTGFFRTYDRSDGLMLNGFHEKSAYPLLHSKGEMYFGAINGMVCFHPANFQEVHSVPRIVLTDMTVMERYPFGDAEVSMMDTLILDYSDRDISFEFAALDFTNPLKNQYAYRLEGYDREWIFSGTRRYIRYTNLDAGVYQFRVKGSNADGIWNDEGLRLYVYIRPPFWQKLWFQLLVLTMLGVFIWMIVHFRIRNIEAQKQKLTELIEERTQELKQKNIELEQLNEKKNEFLGIAAHDLRNPLGAIIGFLDLMYSDMKEGRLNLKEAMADLKMIMNSARQMVQLITELLDISAIESGKIRMDIQPVNLNTLLDDCERIHRKAAQQKHIRLSIEKNPDLPLLWVDRARIMEVNDNLLSNAVKYTYPEGEVHVTTEIHPEEVWVHVRDTGQGLTEKDLQLVFRSFRKLSAIPTGGESSTGFGLAIVKKIVELHHGRVWVESQSGVGSTFSFSIPKNKPVPQ